MLETDIKTIRIELPYVKIGPSEDPCNPEIYSSAGIFFIELPNGEIRLADVLGKELGVGVFPLPASLNSFVSKLLAKKEQQDKESEVLDALDNMDKRLDEKLAYLDDKVARLIDMKKESNFNLSNMLLEHTASIDEIRGQNSQLRTMIEKLGESKSDAPEGGYVNEKTLLEIINSVRK